MTDKRLEDALYIVKNRMFSKMPEEFKKLNVPLFMSGSMLYNCYHSRIDKHDIDVFVPIMDNPDTQVVQDVLRTRIGLAPIITYNGKVTFEKFVDAYKYQLTAVQTPSLAMLDVIRDFDFAHTMWYYSRSTNNQAYLMEACENAIVNNVLSLNPKFYPLFEDKTIGSEKKEQIKSRYYKFINRGMSPDARTSELIEDSL